MHLIFGCKTVSRQNQRDSESGTQKAHSTDILCPGVIKLWAAISMSKYTAWAKCLRSVETTNRCGFAAEISCLVFKSYIGFRLAHCTAAYGVKRNFKANMYFGVALSDSSNMA